jgi:hypothetical protein
MLAVFYLLLKSSFCVFLFVFLHFATKNFIIGFKEGEACKPKPMFINSIENKKLRRNLPKPKEPVKLVEPEIDVEQYYEEQLRIESKPSLKIYYGE